MKFKKLLVLSMLSLTGTSAWAAVPEGVWTMPEPQGLEFTTFTGDETQYVLYNPGAKMFFASGNSWNTQASVRVYGYSFWLQGATESGAPEGSYELWNYVDNPQRTDVTGNHNVFFDGSSFWVDHGSQAGYTWNFTLNGEFVRLGVVTTPDRFIGWDGTYIDSDDEGASCSSVLKNLDPATEGVCVDWKAVTVESYENFTYSDEYETYKEGAKLYIASLGFKKAIEDAEAAGLTCTAAIAVYANTSSTIEELREGKNLVNARIALKNAIDAAKAVYVDVAAAEATLADESSALADVNKAADGLKDITAAKQKLKDLIDDCKSKGYTETADAEAVLQNTAATKSAVEKAESDLAAAYTEWGKNNGSVANPADMTSMIANPNFDNASYTGWLGDAPNMTGSGSHGPANVPEKWNATFDTYQDIAELPAGVYELSVQTMWRGSWNDYVNKVGPASVVYVKIGEDEFSTPFNFAYAPLNTEPMAGETPWGVGAGEQSYTDEEAGVTYYIPNDPSCFRLYAEKGLYDTKLIFGISEGGIRIGVKNPALKGDADNWSVWDTFKLKFFGAGADAAQLYIDESLKNFSEVTIPEGTIYTESCLAAYQQAYSGEKTASSFEEASAIVNSISEAKKALDNNIALWQTYKKTAEESLAKYSTGEYDDCLTVYDLADYIDGDIKYVDDKELPGFVSILAEHSLTNEELQAELDYLNGLCEQIEKEAKEGLKEGDDVTRFLKNADFELCDVTTPTGEAPYWTVKKDVGNVTAGPLGQSNYDLMTNKLGKMNYCFESWHSHDFDVYQEINNAPEGVYVIEVQGYVRCENSGYTQGEEVDPTTIPIKLYMNNAETNFPSIYSEEIAEEHFLEDGTLPVIEDHSWTGAVANYPNSMGAAALCFDWGMYNMTTYGLVKAGDVMRIGVKGKMKTDDTENWWCIWDNFKLTYQGYNVEYVQPALDEAMTNIDISKPMGKDIYATAKGLSDKAAEAKASGDGKTMFQMLADVYDAVADIKASVELFAKLQDAVENETTGLETAIYTSANDQAKAEAETLVSTIRSGIENYSFSDSEVEGLLEQISNMKTKLAMPAGWENATDDNKADFTGVIVNPDYCNPETDLSYTAGWTNPGNPGNDDTQKSAQAMEFWQNTFDMYQDIQGLPKGTYIVQLDAWCRNGGSGDNLEQFNLDNDTTLAFIYAVGEDNVTFAAPVANLMKGAQTEDPYWDGIGVETLNGVDYYLPNSLVGGRAYMDPDIIAANEGVYTNQLIAKVGDDGKLRIGIKKDKAPSSSWVVIDNWRLFYCGGNSSLTPSPDITGVEAVNVEEAARVEFFSLDGRKANSAQKGIFIQKTTLSNGATIIKKIMK